MRSFVLLSTGTRAPTVDSQFPAWQTVSGAETGPGLYQPGVRSTGIARGVSKIDRQVDR